jgi:hypothetical protein
MVATSHMAKDSKADDFQTICDDSRRPLMVDHDQSHSKYLKGRPQITYPIIKIDISDSRE